jgi:hypothetical protein
VELDREQVERAAAGDVEEEGGRAGAACDLVGA